MATNFNSQFERIITQKLQFTFSSLGLGLLFTRLISKYKSNPTPAELKNCIDEVDAFVSKYRAILENDLATLSKL